MPIKVEVDIDALTWQQWDVIEDAATGSLSSARIRPIIAQHMINDEGKPIPEAEAFAQLGALKRPERLDAVRTFISAVREAMDGAVPPPKDGS